jgi:hypothetical protein
MTTTKMQKKLLKFVAADAVDEGAAIVLAMILRRKPEIR